MVAFMLLAPMVFVSMFMSMFAGLMSMLAAALVLVMGMFMGALTIGSTALLGVMILIFS